MVNGTKKKLKSYRLWNFIVDLYFGGLLVLLAIVGSIIFYAGCLALVDFLHSELKEKWELLEIPVAIVWLYFNLKWIYIVLRRMLRRSTKEVVEITKLAMERVQTNKGSYRQWRAYYKDGMFEISASQAEKIQEGQKVELWFKPERKGKGRRNVAVYLI